MPDLDPFAVTGTNNPAYQVSKDRWNAVLEALEGGGSLNVKTPADFGAVGDGVTDDTAALQEFFDDAQDDTNARTNVYDWSAGEYLISDTIYATYYDGGLFGNSPHRKFIAGTLRVAPLASLPGGTPLNVVLEIAGYRQYWAGLVAIHPSGAVHYGTAYASRRYNYGVQLRAVNGSTFPDFQVDDAKYWGVWLNSDSGAFTVRAGTAFEATFPNKNNIGVRMGAINGRYCGSNTRSGSTHFPTSNLVSKTQGGASANAYQSNEVFDPTPGSYGGSFFQRTKLTLGSTAELKQYDLVVTRLELTPSIYGTVAYDNALSRITWTAGDPATLLNVGDVYPVSVNGPNAGVEFRIIGFSGASNREISVTPAPVTDAASGDAARAQYGPYEYSTVTDVYSATEVGVYPWIPDRNNTLIGFGTGGLFRNSGSDGANIQVRQLASLVCGATYWGYGLYGPQIDSVLCEVQDIGLRLGVPGESANHIGIAIEHGHIEGCHVDILSHSINVTGTIDIQSAIDYSKVLADSTRSSTNQQLVAGSIGTLTLATQGTTFTTPSQYVETPSNPGIFPVTNHPLKRDVFVHESSATLTIDLDRDVFRLFPKHHWARILWSDELGSTAPTGTLTLNLHASLAALGWTFGGDGSGTTYTNVNPVAPVVLELQFLKQWKKVVITRPVTWPRAVVDADINGLVLAAGKTIEIGTSQVVGPRQAAIADHASDATVNAILAALRTHGLIAT